MRDIEPGTVLFTIPRTAILTTSTSSLQTALPQLFEPQDDESDEDDSAGADSSWIHLILALMYEFLQAEKSRWWPYINVLPSTFDTPMFWTPSEISQLQASSIVGKIGRAAAEKMFRKRIIPAIQKSPEVFVPAGADPPTAELLMELAHVAGSVIMAYAFNLENDDDENEAEDEEWVEDVSRNVMGMVPMADILNADAEFNVSKPMGAESCLAV